MLRVLPTTNQTCLATNKVVNRFDVGGKTCNTAIQLVLQQGCNTSCTFFVVRFSVPVATLNTNFVGSFKVY